MIDIFSKDAPAAGGNVESSSPSAELLADRDASKMARVQGSGRHPKGCSCPVHAGKAPGAAPAGLVPRASVSPAGGNPAPVASPWTPLAAGILLKSLHQIPAGLTGFDGFLLTPAELEALGPITAEVLTELVPYSASWIKFAMLVTALSGIELGKLRAFQAWKVLEFKKAKAAEAVASQGTKKNDPPAAPTVSFIPAGQGMFPVAPGVDPTRRA